MPGSRNTCPARSAPRLDVPQKQPSEGPCGRRSRTQTCPVRRARTCGGRVGYEECVVGVGMRSAWWEVSMRVGGVLGERGVADYSSEQNKKTKRLFLNFFLRSWMTWAHCHLDDVTSL